MATVVLVAGADLNNDNEVDIIDLGILLSSWDSTSKPPADINQDGNVDIIDLGILLSNWGPVVPTPTPACTKWNPGHYLLPTNEWTEEEVENIFASEEYIEGMQTFRTWRKVETSKDVYDFTHIDSVLDLASVYDKHIFLQLTERTFKAGDIPVPDYILNDPEYGGGVVVRESGSSVARMWDPDVLERFNLMVDALGNRYNTHPNFQGINFPESAVYNDILTGEPTEDFTIEGLVDSMKSRTLNAVEAFPNTVVIHYMNWFGEPYLGEMIEYFYQIGAGIGGPDIVPDEGRTIDRMPAYGYCPLYAGKISLSTATQSENFCKSDMGCKEKGNFTMEGFWDMGLNTLKLNHIFWAGVKNNNLYKFTWDNDILPMINAHQGEINAGCPENIAPCCGD